MNFSINIKASCPKDLKRLLNKLAADASFIFEADIGRKMELDCNGENVINFTVDREEEKEYF